jgi:hypothetical protein
MVGRGEGRTPIAVEPSLMASREYSTWKRRPSGEKVLGVCEQAVLDRGVRDIVSIYSIVSTAEELTIFASCYELLMLAYQLQRGSVKAYHGGCLCGLLLRRCVVSNEVVARRR